MERTSGDRIGSAGADNLIAKLFPAPEAFIISLKTPGIIARGTVMALESDGKYSVLGASTSGSGDAKALTGSASCIVAETTLEEDTTAIAYRTGHFYRNALTAADGYTMTDADENNLRLAGILLSDGV